MTAEQSPSRGSMIQRTGTRKVYSRSPSAYGRVQARRVEGLQMGKQVAPRLGSRTLGSQLVVSLTQSSATPAAGAGSEAVTVMTSSAAQSTRLMRAERAVAPRGLPARDTKARGTSWAPAAGAARSTARTAETRRMT
ncbi:MAG: hypothetical protein IPF99_38180 [Deltaproteobacteria bacterium]|nr:hypothetical protein [Deltaproteobacteria bacterium]